MSLMIYCRSVHIQFTICKRIACELVSLVIIITVQLLKTIALISVSTDSVYRAFQLRGPQILIVARQH
jgi:hypothetical protein